MGSSDKDPIVYVDVPPKVGGGGGGLLTSLTSSAASDVMVTVSANATVGTHGWSALDRAAMTSTKTKNDFVVEVDPTFFDANTAANPGDVTHSRTTQRSRRKLPGCFTLHRPLSSKLFGVSSDSKYIFSGGHWDNSLQTYSVTKHRTVSTV